jgi:hypothetical protein
MNWRSTAETISQEPRSLLSAAIYRQRGLSLYRTFLQPFLRLQLEPERTK